MLSEAGVSVKKYVVIILSFFLFKIAFCQFSSTALVKNKEEKIRTVPLSKLVHAAREPELPQWLTAEESLRVHEIGQGHKITAAPGGWVETPGEFEPLNGVFVTWRYGNGNSQDAIFREIVREVVEVCKAFIIVRSTTERNNVSNYLNSGHVPLDSVEFDIFSNNSIWMRDYGPWFMHKQDSVEGITDYIYNRPRPLDDTIPWRIGADWGVSVYGAPLEHPGGNFMVDGLGTGFVSDLIYEENASFTPHEIDSIVLAYSGIEQLVVMPRIGLEYTHHIDLWAKSLNDTLVMVGEYESGHPNYDILNENADSISRCTNRGGLNYRIVRMPMPWSTSSAPPSYLNSLFVKNKVLVPLWDKAEDDTALFIYQQALPDHEIVGIDCSAMSGSGGAIHCITMQVPSSEFIHVRHYPMADVDDTVSQYRIRAQIMTSSALNADSTIILYKVNTGSFSTVPLPAVADTPGVYAGYIPRQSGRDTIHYYLLTKNADGLRRTSPRNVPPHLYSFCVTVTDSVPPGAPHVVQTTKSGSDVRLVWNQVLTDTLGSAENTNRYIIYRDTVPDFVPVHTDSIGSTVHPDTEFLDIAAVTATQNYYYLIVARDAANNASAKSNMAYIFHKIINENPAVMKDLSIRGPYRQL